MSTVKRKKASWKTICKAADKNMNEPIEAYNFGGRSFTENQRKVYTASVVSAPAAVSPYTVTYQGDDPTTSSGNITVDGSTVIVDGSSIVVDG